MVTPNVCVLRAPGTNCDVETAFAFEQAGARAERLHVFRLLEQPALLDRFQVLCVPGGFSYGDDIGAGVIFSRQLSGRLADALASFLQNDTLALGICNGFQVLLKSGLLPGGAQGLSTGSEPAPEATLTWNDNGKYTAVWVKLKTMSANSVFLKDIDEIDLPVAHAEGRLVVQNEAVLDRWRANSQIALCYQAQCSGTQHGGAADSETRAHPANPNGSVANIAGLSDPSGRILGLMPHPERFIHATQHPHWTRRRMTGEGAGMQLFRNAVAYFG